MVMQPDLEWSAVHKTSAKRWAAVAFDLYPFADYPASACRFPTEEHLEKASWLAGLVAERVRLLEQSALPAFPAMAVRVLNIMQERDPDLKELVRTIREDPGISAQILRMANSVYYSRGVEVETVHDAAVRLGIRSVCNVAVAAATRAMLDAQERERRDAFPQAWRRLSSYCLQCAAGSRWLSIWLARGDPEQAFLAGLLHDVGKIIALRVLGEMVQDGDAAVDMPDEVLEQVLEQTHVTLGTDLAAFWGLPGHVAHVCQEHHQVCPEPAKVNETLHLVRIASSLFEARTQPVQRSTLPEELFYSAHSLGLAREPLQAVAGELKRVGTESERM